LFLLCLVDSTDLPFFPYATLFRSELYWAVICHLIHRVYDDHPKAREAILSRAINGLKRYKTRVGAERYDHVMDIFASGSPALNQGRKSTRLNSSHVKISYAVVCWY